MCKKNNAFSPAPVWHQLLLKKYKLKLINQAREDTDPGNEINMLQITANIASVCTLRYNQDKVTTLLLLIS